MTGTIPDRADRRRALAEQPSPEAARIVVSFSRIGPHTRVPDLVLPDMDNTGLQQRITRYVAGYLGLVVFSICFLGEGGFIGLGAHHGGLLRISRTEATPAGVTAVLQGPTTAGR